MILFDKTCCIFNKAYYKIQYVKMVSDIEIDSQILGLKKHCISYKLINNMGNKRYYPTYNAIINIIK